MDRLCAHYVVEGVLSGSASDGIPPERVIAVLTTTAIDLSLLEIALVKLGLTPLLLSVNNSVAAVAHLCKITSASHLIYGTKFASEGLSVQKMLAEEGYHLHLVEEQRFPLWGAEGVDATYIQPYSARLTPQQERNRTAVILHSSGSVSQHGSSSDAAEQLNASERQTGFPKPIFTSHKGFVANLSATLPKPVFSALPVYHGFGHFSGYVLSRTRHSFSWSVLDSDVFITPCHSPYFPRTCH